MAGNDPYIGVIVAGYEIKERVGAGRIGTVYKAIRKNPSDAVACKIISEHKLRDGWQTEIEKNASLRGIPNVVPYHTFGSAHDKETRPFTFVLFDFIDGWNLRQYCKERNSAIDIAFVEGLIRIILNVLHACKAVGFPHGDLHEGNILVKKSDIRLPGAPVTLWISDFGYGGSRNNIEPKDDYRQTAGLANALLRAIDPTSLTAYDKLVREKLMLFVSKTLLENDPMQGTFVTNPTSLLRSLDGVLLAAKAETAAALSNSHHQDPSDYLTAEALGYRKEEWLQMFVPEFLAAEELLSRNTTILTGARGCGKTMAFRRLTRFMDEVLGAPSGVRGGDQFIGFYMNCRDLAEAFPWLPRKLSPNAEQQILHYFHLNWLNEVFRTLAECETDGVSTQQWLWSFMAGHFPAYSTPVQGANSLTHARSFIEGRKEECRLSPLGKGAPRDTWSLARIDFLDVLQEALETHAPWPRDLPLFFFLDDYTIPVIPRSVQRILNRAIFRRRDKLFFKVSTEAVSSFDVTSLREKPLELGQDFQLIDLATASLHQAHPDKVELLEKVFRPRIDRHPAFKDKAVSLASLLGDNRFNNSEVARQMRSAAQERGKRTILYHGVDAFAGLWTSDFRTLIQVLVDMLRESSRPEARLDSGLSLIESKVQDKIVRAKGGEFLVFAEALTNPDQWGQRVADRKFHPEYGRHLRHIIEAFIEVCRWELTEGRPVVNQGTSNPKQAFRLEILDNFELSAKAGPYYEGLVRWHLFLQDWRGKSARGKLTPRLFLNRILLPYANLTFSTHDNVGLTNRELHMLLESPKGFPSYWAKKRKRQSPDEQDKIDFGVGGGPD